MSAVPAPAPSAVLPNLPTSDYSKDGWGVAPVAGQPKFSGDYFLPGSPLEGWSIEYKTSVAGTENRGIGKQQVGHTVPVTSVSDTSVDGRLSAVWVGLYGVLKISKSTSFGVDDLFFTTTVTLQNTGTSVLYEIDYMRNVDPDQEQVRPMVARCLSPPRCAVAVLSPWLFTRCWCMCGACSRGQVTSPRRTTCCISATPAPLLRRRTTASLIAATLRFRTRVW